VSDADISVIFPVQDLKIFWPLAFVEKRVQRTCS